MAFVLSIPLGVALLLLAGPAEARAAAAVYVVTLVVGFGTSAAYHRLARGPRAVRWMRRADHSSIYLLIAGTYTPICLLALPAPWGLPVLAVVWVGAIVGVILKLTAFDRTRVAGWALYLVLGWAAIIAAPALVRHLTPLEITLIVAGGLIYTGGSIVLATGRPNPFPTRVRLPRGLARLHGPGRAVQLRLHRPGRRRRLTVRPAGPARRLASAP